MTPSNANTSGLEVVQWEYRTAPHRQWHITDSKAVADQEAKDGSEVVPRLVRAASAQARIAELEAERDEADRRAGAAERLLEERTDRIAKRERWLRDAKEARGYHQNVSFDRVWADTCAAADRAALQQEG